MRAFLLGMGCWLFVACGARMVDAIDEGAVDVATDSSSLVDAGQGSDAGLPAALDGGSVMDAGTLSGGDAGTLTAPTALKAITGGTSVALRWTSGTGGFAGHEILRNGVVVGVVSPGFHPEFPEKNGNGFIDWNVQPGSSYTYQVRAVGPNGERSPLSAAVSATHPTFTTAVPAVALDFSQAPDLKLWLEDKVLPFLWIWYPKVGDRLARPEYTPPGNILLRIDPAYAGVAYASGTTIVVSADYARAHPQDLGVFLHESTHVLQSYSGNVPGWTTEGVADWTREFLLHDRDPVKPGIGDYFESGYSEGSYFLNWIQDRYDVTFIHRLNVASHQGTYSDAMFMQSTGLTTDELWAMMTGSFPPGPVSIPRLGKCLDNGTVGSNGSAAVVNDCDGSTHQRWGVSRKAGGTLTLLHGKRCLDVENSGTVSGTKIQLSACNGSGAQVWRVLPDGSLQNPQSGLCLDVPGSSTVNGTQLQLYTCNGTNAQTFTLPY